MSHLKNAAQIAHEAKLGLDAACEADHKATERVVAAAAELTAARLAQLHTTNNVIAARDALTMTLQTVADIAEEGARQATKTY